MRAPADAAAGRARTHACDVCLFLASNAPELGFRANCQYFGQETARFPFLPFPSLSPSPPVPSFPCFARFLRGAKSCGVPADLKTARRVTRGCLFEQSRGHVARAGAGACFKTGISLGTPTSDSVAVWHLHPPASP